MEHIHEKDLDVWADAVALELGGTWDDPSERENITTIEERIKALEAKIEQQQKEIERLIRIVSEYRQ